MNFQGRDGGNLRFFISSFTSFCFLYSDLATGWLDWQRLCNWQLAEDTLAYLGKEYFEGHLLPKPHNWSKCCDGTISTEFRTERRIHFLISCRLKVEMTHVRGLFLSHFVYHFVHHSTY